MKYKIKKVLVSDKFENIRIVFNIALSILAIFNLFYSITFHIQLPLVIMMICLIEIPITVKSREWRMKRKAFEELVDESFLELLDIANRMSNEPKMTISLYITINTHRISTLFVKGCQESLLSFDEYVFIMKCLNSIPSFIKEVK